MATSLLTPAQARVLGRMRAGEVLCTIERAGTVVQARLYHQETGESDVSKVVVDSLLRKQQLCRICWYEARGALHVEYVAAEEQESE